MDQDAMKHTLLTLVRLAREQHKQIDALSVAVTALRSCLSADDDKKVDKKLQDNLVQEIQAGRSADETIRLLDGIEKQIQNQ